MYDKSHYNKKKFSQLKKRQINYYIFTTEQRKDKTILTWGKDLNRYFWKKTYKWLIGNDNLICKTEKETQMYRTEFWTLWEKARVGCCKRTASKHVYYLGWNRSPAQVGCMRQVLGPGALGRPRGIRWRGGGRGESGWGIHVYPWLIHVNVWHKPLQYCKVISLQVIKRN